MKRLIPTAEMTIGPFFPPEFTQGTNDLTVFDGRKVAGEVIEIDRKSTRLNSSH